MKKLLIITPHSSSHDVQSEHQSGLDSIHRFYSFLAFAAGFVLIAMTLYLLLANISH